MEKTRQSKFGFTLIELIMVITIVAIILAVGIPVYNRFYHRQDVRNSVSALVSDIRRAEEEARKAGMIMAINAMAFPAQPTVAVINSSNVLIYSHPVSTGIAVAGSPILPALRGCVGAAALQLPDGTALVFNQQGIPVTCAGGPITNGMTTCGVVTVPGPASFERLTVTDPGGNAATVCIDVRTGDVTSQGP